ncbi:MAG TPA: two-component system regulatory protein YycI [Bacillota bacterium]|nr:two-component system regulatory protein YycI [Bacillota bacterium]
MQWSRIKTLFILCFLVLDIYLLFIFLDKQKEADIAILERPDMTIENQLEAENIKVGKLPEEQPDESFLSVKQKEFTDSEIQKLEKKDHQQLSVINDTLIFSQFDDPIAVPDKAKSETITELIKDQVLHPEEYVFWDWNKEFNVILFFQKKNDRPIYFNQNGMILFFLNDDNEIVSYTQTMLGEQEDRDDKKSIIKPIKAIETLYRWSQLNEGEQVTSMNMGYHTIVPLPDGVQVFVPTWKVTVNDERNYFVNAIEGFIFWGKDEDFLEETMEEYSEKVRSSESESELREDFLRQLNKKLDMSNQRGDKE